MGARAGVCAGRMGTWVASHGTRTELGPMPRFGPICMVLTSDGEQQPIVISWLI